MNESRVKHYEKDDAWRDIEHNGMILRMWRGRFDDAIIIKPHKYYGLPRYAPYFIERVNRGTEYDLGIRVFRLSKKHFDRFPELGLRWDTRLKPKYLGLYWDDASEGWEIELSPTEYALEVWIEEIEEREASRCSTGAPDKSMWGVCV